MGNCPLQTTGFQVVGVFQKEQGHCLIPEGERKKGKHEIPSYLNTRENILPLLGKGRQCQSEGFSSFSSVFLVGNDCSQLAESVLFGAPAYSGVRKVAMTPPHREMVGHGGSWSNRRTLVQPPGARNILGECLRAVLPGFPVFKKT